MPYEVMVPRQRAESWGDEKVEIPKVAQAIHDALKFRIDLHPDVAWVEGRAGE